ncbi:Ig-like domain-containing protein [Pantoea sp. A4]|uniref:Ig-like domain-containing protein n=1 Tax=Pantoea sp. A4 TaxID=1225184 RepID=UPI00035CDC7F|nr:Ig-like domain-containing protein [Pantoea sp. A4]
MAECQNSNERLFGGAVVLEVADGCSDTVPAEGDWKSLAAGTSKTFDFSPNSVTSDADDGGGYVESIITNADFTLSFEGEVRKKDKLDQYGVGKLIKYFAGEVAAKRQPGIWVRMEFGPVTFRGYMNITALSSDGGTNDISTFSTEFKVGDSSTIQVYDTVEDVPVTGVTVAPTNASVAAGSSTNFTVNIAPNDATDQSFTAVSSVPARATVSINGSTVTVSAPSVATAGTANITVTSNDGAFTATFVVTVTV